MFDRNAAWGLLTEFTQSESLRKHALAVEACMQACARKFDRIPDREGRDFGRVAAKLLLDEILVAGEFPGRSSHDNGAGGCAAGDDCGYVCVRNHSESGGRDTVEGDSRCAGEALRQNLSRAADFAGVTYQRGKGAETHVKAENGTESVLTSAFGCSVYEAARVLSEGSGWDSAALLVKTE